MNVARHFAVSPPVIAIDQLNQSQWHARFPNGKASGVNSWVRVVADALLYASLNGAGVESLDLAGNHLVLALPESVR